MLAPFGFLAGSPDITKASNPPEERRLLASVYDIKLSGNKKSAICEMDANSTSENSDTVIARAKLGYCSVNIIT